MLLESVLADFSQEAMKSRGHPSTMPFVWDDKMRNNSFTRSRTNSFAKSDSYNERVSMLRVQENEVLLLQDEAENTSDEGKNQKGAHQRSDSGQFYHNKGTVPFKWEEAPGKPAVIHQTITTTSESPRLQPPPALRTGPVPMDCDSPRRRGIAGKLKRMLSGKGSRNTSSNAQPYNNLEAASSSRSSSTQAAERDQWSSTSDQESPFDSDGGADDLESSPVSTLDRPASPQSPDPSSPRPESPIQETLAIVPVEASTSRSADFGTSSSYPVVGIKNLSRNGSWKHLVASISEKEHSQAQTSSTFLTEMPEELPMILEDEEESEFHTMEFASVDSSGTIQERRERSLTRRTSSSKSLSAPLPHEYRQSSLGSANRQRRRSDFDWPDEFQDRPEEVVKEVDDSLWAFSPVSSTFVFSANEYDNSGPSTRSPARMGGNDTGISTPASTSSGSIREILSVRKPIPMTRSASTRSSYDGKSSAEAAAVHAELLHQSSRLSFDDDEVYHRRGGRRLKKAFSCILFWNPCRAHEPPLTPDISFTSRLNPNLALESS